MTVRANKFTPEVLLAAPRRSAANPNSDGTFALVTVSTYSFHTHKKTSEIQVLDIKTGEFKVLTDDISASEPIWLGPENLVLWLKGEEKGKTALYRGDASQVDEKPELLTTFNGSVSNLKATDLGHGSIGLAFTALSTPSGDMYNPETEQKQHSTGKVYNSLFVRQWDAYVTENTSAIWYTTLKLRRGVYTWRDAPLVNALAGHAVKLESPVPPFGGAGDFDISKNGLVFVAKYPELNHARHTRTDLYYIPLRTFEEKRAPAPMIVKTGNLKGYSNGPVFAPNSRSVAFTRQKVDGYEADKPRLLLVPDIMDLTNVQEFYETEDGKGSWDSRPDSITWSNDGEELYVTAEENGRGKLFKLPSSPRHAKALPTAITNDGTVTDVKVLSNNKLLVSSSSLIDSSIYTILNPSQPTEHSVVSSNSNGGKNFGLSQSQVEEIWFQGAEDYSVHAWVYKPSNFDKSKKYPLCYLIHGGPQGAWNEGWSTRWNPAIFAEQGYVVVTPNPTGSTGYGMALQNGIQNQWGGRPYIDLVKGFEYIESNLAYVDTTRAVALGASYGGYMVNWIQGQPLGRKFKALVTHDGVFSTLGNYSTDELFFPNHEFGGTLYDNREGYEKWDPARHLNNWATPHLIIHSELDYRLPIVEGMAPFNVLQSKEIPSRLLTFSDENHWVLKPENSLVWHREVLGWINKYSGIAEEQERLRKELDEVTVSEST